MMLKGKIHSTESFGSVDGPGVRYLIFFQGCPMRCLYCHNADTWDTAKGELKSADELLDLAERYRGYWGKKGGITVSGGEPLAQPEFLLELLEKAKQKGIHTCVDTSGQPFSKNEPFFSVFERICESTDLFLVDIKHIRREEHIELTGHENGNILEMLRYLSDAEKPVWIRHVLVPGITDNDLFLRETREFIDTLKNIRRVEVLPYHSMGAYKWRELGYDYSLEGTTPPDEERIENARRILTE